MMEEMLTPPQFIWESLKKSLTITIMKKGKEKEIKYKIPEFKPVPDLRCWLCGGKTNGIGLRKKDRISKMFSDTEYAQYPNSNSLCSGCGGILSNASIRFYSLFATEEVVTHPLRHEWRDILTSPPAGLWFGGLSVSSQKYLFYKAPINLSSKRCTVALEDFTITYRPETLKGFLQVVEPMLNVFSKEEIRTGNYNQGRIRTYGIMPWQEAEERLLPIRNTPMMELVLYVAIKKEDYDATTKDNCKPSGNKTVSSQLEFTY